MVSAKDPDGIVTTTKDGQDMVTFQWGEEDVGTIKEVEVTLNKGWNIADAAMVVEGRPLMVDDGQGGKVAAYPERPRLYTGGTDVVWEFPGTLGHQTEFAGGTTGEMVVFLTPGERLLEIPIPVEAEIDNMSMEIHHITSGKYEYDIYVGDSKVPAWSRSTIGFDQGPIISTDKGISSVCISHLDFLFDDHYDIVGVGEEGSVHILMHDGSSPNGYSDVEVITVGEGDPPPKVLDCALDDYDQDIDTDLAVSTADGNIYLIVNEGWGQFAPPQVINGSINRMESVTFGDVNNDGWLDIVSGYLTGKVYISHYNNTKGTYDDPTEIVVGSGALNDIVVKDMGHDLYPDIIAASNDRNWWYVENDKGEGFKDPVPIRSSGLDLTSLVVADLDHNGDPDLISGNLDGAVYISFHDEGIYEEGVALKGGQGSMKDIVIGDVDRDHDLDILGLNSDGYIYVFENEYDFEGQGQIKEGVRLMEVGKDIHTMAMRDLDNDGDPDLVLGNGKGFVIFYNRQGPFDDVIGGEDDRLRSAVQDWLDNLPPRDEDYDEYGNHIANLPLRIISAYSASPDFDNLTIDYSLGAMIDIETALELYIKRNSELADAKGFLDVPLQFVTEGPGTLELRDIHIEYTNLFMAVLDQPSSGDEFYPNSNIVLHCHSNEDPAGTSGDFTFEWTVDTRELGEGPMIKIKGSELGGLGNHTVKCTVTKISDLRSSHVTIFLDLAPNTPPEINDVPEQKKVEVDHRLKFQVKGEDEDPWDATNLTYSLEKAPEGLGIDPLNGIITWVPGKADLGLHLITIRLSDGKEFTNASLSIMVQKAKVPLSLPQKLDQHKWLIVFTIGLMMFGFVMVGTEVGIFAFYAFLFFLYTRLKREKVLDNFVRGTVFGHISENPGIHFSELKRKLDMANGTLTYHLRTLEREELIRSYPNGTNRVFFPANMKVPKDLLKLTRAQRMVLDVVKDNPSISQKRIGKETGLSSSTVSRIVIELRDRGFIEMKKGRTTKCYIKET